MDSKKSELNDEALESVSGGLTSVCKKCGATGIVVSETQLCEMCHNSEMYAKYKELQELWQASNTLSTPDTQNQNSLPNIARGQ